MVRKIGNFFLIAVVVAVFMVKSSTSNPIQNDILEELKVELKSLRAKVDLLEAKDLKQEEKITKLEEKIDAKLLSDRLSPVSFSGERAIHSADNEINQVDGKQNPRIGGKANEIINSIKRDDSDNFFGASNGFDDSTDNNSRMNLIFEQKIVHKRPTDDSSPRAIAPSSCRELSLLGHSLDGFYLVQNVETNKIETVLCDFGTSLSQQLIGDVNVKTKSVHFYVQRTTTFSTGGTIPWEISRLNEGVAMNLISGIFTVPVPGIYHFEFSGLKEETASFLSIFLQVNGVTIGAAGTDLDSPKGSFEMYSLTASLRLKAGDTVSLYNVDGGILFEGSSRKNHFAGWLVEEDLSPVI